MTGPLGPTGADAEQWVADWSASISARAAAARELSEKVAELTVTAAGADDAVRVTVAGSGVMTDLRLTDRVLEWPADRIAAEVLKTMRVAQGRLAEQVADAAAGTVGLDSETGRSVVAGFERRFPVVPDEDDDDAGRPMPGRPFDAR